MSFSSDLLGFSNHCIQDPQMLPSSNYNVNDLISYSDINPISHTPFHNYTINPNSSKHLDEQYPPANFLHLPSPILHNGLEVLEEHDVFNFYNPQPPMKGTDDSVSYFRGEESTSIEKRNSKTAKINKVLTKTTTTGGKKSGKKDRHSKINTAQGLRDRRMRLSLKVARDFFDLQDKLGYDKASKTVEWLLTQAKAEIKKLITSGLPNMNFMSCSVNNAAKSASSATNSECEVMSQIDIIEPKESSIGVKKKERLDSSSRKNAFRRGPIAKESREKARARARERTRLMKLCDHHREATPCKYDQLSKLSSWSPFEASDSSSGHNNNPSMEVEDPSYHDQQENTTTTTTTTTQEDMVDNNSSVIMNKYWNVTTCLPTFGYLPNSSTSTTTGIPQQNQSTDFQFFSKPWDSYNNHNLY